RPAAPATEPVSLVASRPPAVVRLVTSLPPTATFQISTYANDPHAGIYTEYEVTLTYHDDRGGRYVGQATKEGEPGKVFQRTNPQVTLVAEWTARKYGGPPKVPDPDTTDGNAICVDVGAVLESINVAADGITPVFTASGTYKYEFLDAKKVSLVTPVPPWMALSPSQVPGYPTGGKDVFGNGTRTSTLRSR
ncbi:MAG TPA: hypothetical protein VEI97_16405, partial [bacterium]|nr:hypothetical protein [bacterium]